MAAALSRFGTWSNLKITASSHTDVDAETHTFSFYGATFTSPYITFVAVEQYSNVPVAGGGYTTLENPTKEEAGDVIKYSCPKYLPDATAGQIGFPFININNVALISGASYDPGILAGLTWTRHRRRAGRPHQPGDPGHRGHGQLHLRRHLPAPRARRPRCARAPASRPRPRRCKLS